MTEIYIWVYSSLSELMKKKKELKDNRGCLQKYLNGQSGQFTVRAKGKQNLKESKEFQAPQK